MSKKVIVIGSGFSGLSSAASLAKMGYDVTVLEKHGIPGGRARQYTTSDGFVFDMGPSWYWMPDVFEDFYQQFGHTTKDFYELERLDPSYAVYFKDKIKTDIPASKEELIAFFEKTESGSGNKLELFLKEAAYKYDVGIKKLVYKPSRSLFEFVDPKLLYGLIKMDVFNSLSSSVRKLFKSPKLIELLEFPVLFLGAKPQNIPALYSLMNYADMELGTWYPKGGMYKIVQAMFSIAQEQGAKFKFNHNVMSVEMSNNSITKVVTNQGTFEADVVVGSADYHHIDQHLLPKTHRNYSPEYWDKRVMAPSSLIFYLGINKKLQNLEHHNLFFDEDFTKHAEEIYDTPKWPNKPLFYVCAPSVTDKTVAPEGSENLFILVPTAPGLQDSEEHREQLFNQVIERLENLTNNTIKNNIVYKRSFAHSDFVNDYNAFKGNAYGLANTLMQTAILKPALKNKHIKNLFYTGQLTVPGPGVPPSIISGRVVASEIAKEF